MKNIVRVGVTGPSGAGKGLVCSIFTEDERVYAIDGDKLARQVVQKGNECLIELTGAFGREILDENGELIRKNLAQIAFSDEEKLKTLNRITHKYIRMRTDEIISSLDDKIEVVLIDGAALIEGNYKEELFCMVAVVAPYELRRERIMMRDGISKEQAELRMNAQKPNEFYVQNCDYTIVNDGSIEKVEKDCEEILRKIFDAVKKS